MPTNSAQLPDLSADFMAWLNTELRKRIEEPEETYTEEGDKSGIVNRLKAYLTGAASLAFLLASPFLGN